MKQKIKHCKTFLTEAAAFGRLCVETIRGGLITPPLNAAAFGRLCVETVVKIV